MVAMNETTTTTVTGLRMCAFASPFNGYTGALVDIEGPWTDDMLAVHDEEPEFTGLWVWEGQCVVTVECAGTEDEDTTFAFEGKSRAPTNEEMQLLAAGQMPLRGIPMPATSGDLLDVERRLRIFDVYGSEEEIVIAYSEADARALMLTMVTAADLEEAVFDEFEDDDECTRRDENDVPVTKTAAEWCRQEGRGYFASCYA